MVGCSNMARMADNDEAVRSHSGAAYLSRTAGRVNLSVLIGAHTTKIAIVKEGDELIAKEVHFDVHGNKYSVRANKEIILSAGKCKSLSMRHFFNCASSLGSYQSPQILELSGIGKASVLNQFSIETLLELPVGENLQEHILVSTSTGFTDEASGEWSISATY